jgi:hypothetical protein
VLRDVAKHHGFTDTVGLVLADPDTLIADLDG